MVNVIAAYGVGWTAILIYVLTLAARQRKLQTELARLEERVRGSETPGRNA